MANLTDPFPPDNSFVPVLNVNTLPRPLTPFIGRHHERRLLFEGLTGHQTQLVTLHGSGGIGKTRLAIEVASDLSNTPRFHGILYAPLEDLPTSGRLPSRLTELLGLPAGPDPWSDLSKHFGSRSYLIVLDNFELFLDQVSALLSLLSDCPNVKLLITSRETLGVQAEMLLSLSGLPLPHPDDSWTTARASEAVQLFEQRAKQADLAFELTPKTLFAVTDLCQMLGGSPLGIELAAAWLRYTSLEELHQSLRQDLLSLATPYKDLPERHQTMRAVFEYSWQRLTQEEGRGLQFLAVFVGGFTAKMAAEVAGVNAQALLRLESKALLRRETPARYSFHPLIREAALAKLMTKPEDHRAVLQARTAFFLRALSHFNAQTSGGVSPELVAFLAVEEANIVAVVEHLIAERRYAELALATEPLLWTYPLKGRFQEGLAFCDRIMDLLGEDAETREVRASFLAGASWLNVFAGRLDRAQECALQALRLLAAAPSMDKLLELRVMECAGKVHYRAHRLAEAKGYLNEAVRLARELRDATRLMRALNNYGVALALMDDSQGARLHLGEAQALYERNEVKPGMDVIWLFSNVGVEHMLRRELQAACALWAEGADLTVRAGLLGQRPTLLALQAFAQLELALQSRSALDFAVVKRHLDAGLAMTSVSRENAPHAMLLSVRGRLALEHGGLAAGMEDILAGVERAWTTGNVTLFHWLLPYVVDALCTQGDITSAGELLGFLLHCPQIDRWTRERASRVRTTLVEGGEFEQAMARGAQFSSRDAGTRFTQVAAVLVKQAFYKKRGPIWACNFA